MLKLAFVAGALLLAPMSVVAQECEYRFDPIIGEFSAAGAPVEVIPEADLPKFVEVAEAITGRKLSGVTRGFLVIAGGNIILGLEADDCMLDPIVIGTSGQPASDRTSGRNKDGGIGA
jgi:hypothetical protein